MASTAGSAPSAAASAALMTAAVLGACDGGGYDVIVHVPGDPARAVRVEVTVLESCDEVLEAGDPPEAPLKTVIAGRGKIGWLDAGTYCLYGRAWEDGCHLYAAGFTPIRIEDGRSGTFELFLAEVPPRGCDDGGACEGDACVRPDAGDEADAGPDGGTDGGATGCMPPPAIVGSLPFTDDAVGVAVHGGSHALVATGRAGLQIVDVTDPRGPALASAVETGGSVDAVAVSTTDSMAYVADYGIVGGLLVVDISEPDSPESLGRAEIREPATVAVTDVGGRPHAIVGDWQGTLTVVDVSDPNAPGTTGSLVDERTADMRLYGVAASGSLAAGAWYDMGYGESSVFLVDLEEPTLPRIVGWSPVLDGPAFDVAMSSSAVFVANGKNGLQILAAALDEIPILGNAVGQGALGIVVSQSETTALVAGGRAGLVVIDVTQPGAPWIAAVVDTPGNAWDVAVSGSLAVVADREGGLQVVDLGCLAP